MPEPSGVNLNELTKKSWEQRASFSVHKYLNNSKLNHLARPALLALCLACAPGPPVLAQSPTPRPQTNQANASRLMALPPDRTMPLPSRRADAARLRELAGQREFTYVEAEANSDALDSFWGRVWRWLNRFKGSDTGGFEAKYLWYAAILAALVFAVLKLLEVDITAAFGRSGRRGQLAYDTTLENIHEVNFQGRIAEAESTGNFRLALRLGYLEVLKHLTDRGYIHWQPDKTNHAYLAEVAAGSLRDAFRAATREFEYVWYGELRLNAALYQQARTSQRVVTGLLASRRPAIATATDSLPA